jgi:hypothetical protein
MIPQPSLSLFRGGRDGVEVLEVPPPASLLPLTLEQAFK